MDLHSGGTGGTLLSLLMTDWVRLRPEEVCGRGGGGGGSIPGETGGEQLGEAVLTDEVLLGSGGKGSRGSDEGVGGKGGRGTGSMTIGTGGGGGNGQTSLVRIPRGQ